MKVYKYLIAFFLTFCVLLSMSFVAFADTSNNTNTNETSNQNQSNEVTVPVEDITNIGTTPEVQEEIIIEDEQEKIAYSKLPKQTLDALQNKSVSNNDKIEIIDENVPFSATIEKDKTSKAVPLDNTPKTGDSNVQFYIFIFICIFSLGCIIIFTKLHFKEDNYENKGKSIYFGVRD